LELLLFSAIPRQNTNHIAHALVKHFGKFSAVLEASKEELCAVDGIGESAAHAICLARELVRRYEICRAQEGKCLDTTAKSRAYVTPFFHGYTAESAWMICLDAKFRVLSKTCLAEGTVTGVTFNYRRVVEIALKRKAVYVLLAHNHPGGLHVASTGDIQATQRLVEALSLIQIQLWDHIIVGERGTLSLREDGTIAELERLHGWQ